MHVHRCCRRNVSSVLRRTSPTGQRSHAQRMDVEASPDNAAVVDASEHSPLLHTKVGSKGAARTAVIHLTASPATHGSAQRAPQQLPRDNLKSIVSVVVWYGSNIGCGSPATLLLRMLSLPCANSLRSLSVPK